MAFETKLSLGIWGDVRRRRVSTRFRSTRENEGRTDLEVLIERDDGRRREAKTETVGEREPVPELGEEGHSDDGAHVLASRLGQQRNSDVPSSGVDDSLSERRSELGHRVLVLVGNDGREGLSDGRDLGILRLGLLDEDHGERDKGSLTDEVDGVLGKGLEEIDGLLLG